MACIANIAWIAYGMEIRWVPTDVRIPRGSQIETSRAAKSNNVTSSTSTEELSNITRTKPNSGHHKNGRNLDDNVCFWSNCPQAKCSSQNVNVITPILTIILKKDPSHNPNPNFNTKSNRILIFNMGQSDRGHFVRSPLLLCPATGKWYCDASWSDDRIRSMYKRHTCCKRLCFQYKKDYFRNVWEIFILYKRLLLLLNNAHLILRENTVLSNVIHMIILVINCRLIKTINTYIVNYIQYLN